VLDKAEYRYSAFESTLSYRIVTDTNGVHVRNAFSVLVLKDSLNLTTQETQFIEILHTVPKWVLDNAV